MKILIGYDGSDCAKAAIKDLRRAGLPATGEALVMSVADLLTQLPYAEYGSADPTTAAMPHGIVVAARDRAAEVVQDAQRAATEGADLLRSVLPGWTVQADSVAESPYWALIKKAEQWNADLVVVGSH